MVDPTKTYHQRHRLQDDLLEDLQGDPPDEVLVETITSEEILSPDETPMFDPPANELHPGTLAAGPTAPPLVPLDDEVPLDRGTILEDLSTSDDEDRKVTVDPPVVNSDPRRMEDKSLNSSSLPKILMSKNKLLPNKPDTEKCTCTKR